MGEGGGRRLVYDSSECVEELQLLVSVGISFCKQGGNNDASSGGGGGAGRGGGGREGGGDGGRHW